MKIFPTEKSWSYRMQQIFWAPFNAWSITNYDPPRNACWYFLLSVFVGVLSVLSPVLIVSFLGGVITVWTHVLHILPWGDDPLMDWPMKLYKMTESPITFIIPFFAAIGFVVGLVSVAAAGFVSVYLICKHILGPLILWSNLPNLTRDLLKKLGKTALAQFLKKYLVDKPCQLCRNIDFKEGTLERPAKEEVERLFDFSAISRKGTIAHTAYNIDIAALKMLEIEFNETSFDIVVTEVCSGGEV